MGNRIPTPNYILDEDFVYYDDNRNAQTIQAGEFVRPINIEYVPKHVLEDGRWWGYNKETDVFCYTRFGMLLIPKKLIVRV